MSSIPKIINQVFEIKHKLQEIGTEHPSFSGNFDRNLNRLFSIFEEEGFIIQDPTNEPYSESRTDCEASIVGKPSSKMKISKTLKPVIYQKTGASLQLVQKGVVIVEKN